MALDVHPLMKNAHDFDAACRDTSHYKPLIVRFASMYAAKSPTTS
jgi:hypothetical protein